MESDTGGQKRRILLVVLIILLLYILLLGRQGVAADITVDAGLAYVAAGQYGGLTILDVRDPLSIHEVGFYNTIGSASRFVLLGKQLFIADGKAGLEIVDASNPALPVAIGRLDLAGETLDVTLAGNYAYLSMGKDGIAVVDVTDRTNPLLAGAVDTPGSARAAAAMQVFAAPEGIQPGTLEFTQQARLQAVFLYVADGSAGLQVIDATDPAAMQVIGQVNTPGLAQDIVMSGYVGFVADGKAGVRVYDLRSPAQPVEVAHYEVPGYVYSLNLAGTRLYAAAGDGGLIAIEVSDLANPQVVSTYQGVKNVRASAVAGNIGTIAAGEYGVQTIQLGGVPFPLAFWETPGDANLDQLAFGSWNLLSGRLEEVQPKVGRTIVAIIFDLLLLLLLVGFWLAFYAQFILPVRTLSDRRRAAERVIAYHLGTRGPAIFIQNGEILARRREKGRIGPGMAILDTASAAVLRTEHSFTRAVGPGLVFTRRKEIPAGVIDLHRQTRTLGPFETDDPFAPQQAGESPEAFDARTERRYSTSSLTRDGVEVAPNVTVSFSLDAVPGEGGTLFGYKGDSVWRAIAREGVDPRAESGSDQRRIEWAWLPARLAVDVWRELLRKFTLDELFRLSTPGLMTSFPQLASGEQEPPADPPGSGLDSLTHTTAFDVIAQNVCQRLTSLAAVELDDLGCPTGVLRSSKEHELLLSRGIKVLDVTIHNLRFPAEVESRLVDQWQASWLERAREEARLVEALHAQVRSQGQDQAAKQFAATTSQLLGTALAEEADLPIDESLRLLVKGTLKLCVRDVDLAPRLSGEKAALLELIEWIGKQ